MSTPPTDAARGFTRRTFLVGAGVLGAIAAIADQRATSPAVAEPAVDSSAPERPHVTLLGVL